MYEIELPQLHHKKIMWVLPALTGYIDLLIVTSLNHYVRDSGLRIIQGLLSGF